jgi:TonB family protein
MAKLCRTIVLGLLLAGVALPLTADSKVDHPAWVKKPDEQTLSLYYPVRAQFKNADGIAVIVCRVIQDGQLSGCRAVEESPVDHGFGDAALSLVSHFQLAGRTPSGKSTFGMKVKIPVRFSAKRPHKSPTPATPRSQVLSEMK